jgi:alanyl-tRNA synthetase
VFQIDLTELIFRERGIEIDKDKFKELLDNQRKRSRNVIKSVSEDWQYLKKEKRGTLFIGYEKNESSSEIIMYREVKLDDQIIYNVVFDSTPFYPESGGQVGDIGYMLDGDEKINIIKTYKENDLIVHVSENLPKSMENKVKLIIDNKRRGFISKNHSATHLLHAALRNVLGDHVSQKGSLKV